MLLLRYHKFKMVGRTFIDVCAELKSLRKMPDVLIDQYWLFPYLISDMKFADFFNKWLPNIDVDSTFVLRAKFNYCTIIFTSDAPLEHTCNFCGYTVTLGYKFSQKKICVFYWLLSVLSSTPFTSFQTICKTEDFEKGYMSFRCYRYDQKTNEGWQFSVTL